MALKYKVGDKVRIKSLDWYNENKDRYGYINCGDSLMKFEKTQFCGKIVTISSISDVTDTYGIEEDDGVYSWTDEMIEGLVEEETKPKPKFYIGDRVYSITRQRDVIIQEILPDGFYIVGELYGTGWYKSHETSLYKEKMDIPYQTNLNYTELFKNEISLPEGYIFKDENGNEILTSKIILEKKKLKYPQSYEECCQYLGFVNNELVFEGDYRETNFPLKQWKRLGLMNQLNKLLICCDAYWKIAGEEMGLGKPWEPDYNNEGQIQYGLYDILKYSHINPSQFVFPTPEMRDAFYDNFKELIETIKT